MQAWRRLGAWRTAPPVSKEGNLQRMVPGFLIGTGMFVVAVGMETIFGKKKSH